MRAARSSRRPCGTRGAGLRVAGTQRGQGGGITVAERVLALDCPAVLCLTGTAFCLSVDMEHSGRAVWSQLSQIHLNTTRPDTV